MTTTSLINIIRQIILKNSRPAQTTIKNECIDIYFEAFLKNRPKNANDIFEGYEDFVDYEVFKQIHKIRDDIKVISS